MKSVDDTVSIGTPNTNDSLSFDHGSYGIFYFTKTNRRNRRNLNTILFQMPKPIQMMVKSHTHSQTVKKIQFTSTRIPIQLLYRKSPSQTMVFCISEKLEKFFSDFIIGFCFIFQTFR